jgi:hypothetical protein
MGQFKVWLERVEFNKNKIAELYTQTRKLLLGAAGTGNDIIGNIKKNEKQGKAGSKKAANLLRPIFNSLKTLGGIWDFRVKKVEKYLDTDPKANEKAVNEILYDLFGKNHEKMLVNKPEEEDEEPQMPPQGQAPPQTPPQMPPQVQMPPPMGGPQQQAPPQQPFLA